MCEDETEHAVPGDFFFFFGGGGLIAFNIFNNVLKLASTMFNLRLCAWELIMLKPHP